MLCLSGFELYSRWVPLTVKTTKIDKNKPSQFYYSSQDVVIRLR